MTKIISIILALGLFTACSHKNDNVGLEDILKQNKIKVKDKRSKEVKNNQKVFSNNAKMSVEEAIVEFGKQTHYKHTITITKGDILNPKEITIE